MYSNAMKGFARFVLAGVGVALLGLLLISAPNAHAQDSIRADSLKYNTPRTHYYSITDGDFIPGNGLNAEFATSIGNGGTYLAASGTGWFAAGLHLPDGAVITELRAYVDDVASGDLLIWISRLRHSGDGFTILASVESSGTPGITDYVDTTISPPVIDNQQYGYHVRVYGANWPGDFTLKIKGVVVTYTIAEAD